MIHGVNKNLNKKSPGIEKKYVDWDWKKYILRKESE